MCVHVHVHVPHLEATACTCVLLCPGLVRAAASSARSVRMTRSERLPDATLLTAALVRAAACRQAERDIPRSTSNEVNVLWRGLLLGMKLKVLVVVWLLQHPALACSFCAAHDALRAGGNTRETASLYLRLTPSV